MAGSVPRETIVTVRYTDNLDTLEPLLKRLRTSDFWHISSAEALARCMIDLLLFERLSRIQNDKSFAKLALKAEKKIRTMVPGGQKEIVGDMDYVIGYGGSAQRPFISSLVVVEAKRGATLGAVGSLSQCVAYMGGFYLTCSSTNSI